MSIKNTRKMVMISMFIALDVIFTRFLSYDSPTLRIGFAFVPVALCAMFFGPMFGGMAAAIADVLGVMLFSKGGYFPGLTLTAFLSGAVYGVFLYNKPKTVLRVGAAVLIVCLILNMGLDTLWLKMITGKAYLALLPPRMLKSFVMIPIQIPVIALTWKAVKGYAEPFFC